MKWWCDGTVPDRLILRMQFVVIHFSQQVSFIQYIQWKQTNYISIQLFQQKKVQVWKKNLFQKNIGMIIDEQKKAYKIQKCLSKDFFSNHHHRSQNISGSLSSRLQLEFGTTPMTTFWTITNFVTSFHSNPLRYWPILFLLFSQYFFYTESFMCSLQRKNNLMLIEIIFLKNFR